MMSETDYRCPDCGREDCTGEDCYWPDAAGIAVEAALKLADDWDAKAREIAAQITSQDTEGAVAGFKMIGVTRYQEGAKSLRSAITAALTGKEAD